MCQTILQIHACGCPGQLKRDYCPLPMRNCDERLRNLERQSLPHQCDRHARLRGRNVPNQPYDDVHPALRRGPPKPQPSSSSVYMSATMRNPARDLASIDMPAAHPHPRQGSDEVHFHSTLRDVSEIPHIPQIPSRRGTAQSQSQTRRGSSSPRISSPAGVSKARGGNAFNYTYGHNPSPRKATPSRSSRPSPRSASYAEVQREAVLQRQAEVRAKREHRQQCERLIASNRLTHDQLMRHPLIQQLSEQDRFSLFYDAEQRERERQNERQARNQNRAAQKSRCVVM